MSKRCYLDIASKEILIMKSEFGCCLVQRLPYSPYEAFLVFRTMFEAACVSKDYSFRSSMAVVVDLLFHPEQNYLRTRIPEWWSGNRTIVFRAFDNLVDANFIIILDVNLKRLRLLERLRVVRLFLFSGTLEEDKHVLVEGQRILQNRYVYDKVVESIPADRLFVRKQDRKGLPPLPVDYRLLNVEKEPYFQSLRTHKRIPEGMTFL